MTEKSPFEILRGIDVSQHIEKKGKFNYLSWAWAVDQLLLKDPQAVWEHKQPEIFSDATMMVNCTVTAFGITRTMHLPVMDSRNAPISNPNAFHINTAMMRCLVKCIALHGLGLYIYAGEDLPEPVKEEHDMRAVYKKQNDFINQINEAATPPALERWYGENETFLKELPQEQFDLVYNQYENRLNSLLEGTAEIQRWKFAGAEEEGLWLKKAADVISKCETIEALAELEQSRKGKILGLTGKRKAEFRELIETQLLKINGEK